MMRIDATIVLLAHAEAAVIAQLSSTFLPTPTHPVATLPCAWTPSMSSTFQSTPGLLSGESRS